MHWLLVSRSRKILVGDELPMTAAEGEAKLIEQGSSGKDIDHTGFRFQLTITTPGDTEESEDVTLLDIGGIKDIFWVSEILEDANGDDLVNFSDVAVSNTHIFRQGESSAELYVPAEAETPATWKSIPFSINEYFGNMVDAFLYVGHNLSKSAAMTRGTDETIDGRLCCKYSLDIPAYLNYNNVSFTIWFDDEYGYTRKIAYDDKMSDIFNYDLAPVLSNPEKPAALEALNLWD